MLARREHSRRELHDKLERRGYQAEAISPVLDALEAEALLQDRRFAEVYVASRMARGFGPVRIRRELQQRGVAAELIDATCDGADPAWSEHAVSVWRKRFSQTPADSYSAWAKQARYLQQRGFDSEQISTALGDFDE